MDIVSFILGLMKGLKDGASNVTWTGGDYAFSDPNSDGNITISKKGGE